MCTTRSRFQTAPATDRPPEPPLAAEWQQSALIIVGHGSAGNPRANRVLVEHAEALARRRLFAEVHATALHGGMPAPSQILSGIRTRRAYIVPLLMCDGRTAQDDMPSAFGLTGPTAAADAAALPAALLCPPVGTHPQVADLITRRVLERLALLGLAAGDTAVLLVGHGSPNNSASQAATEAQAERVRRQGLFRDVVTAYLEQPPLLAEVLHAVAPPLAVVGLFAAPGVHATHDVETAIAARGGTGISYLGAIGGDEQIAEIILAVAAEQARPLVSVAPRRADDARG
jgi:sirohydrochlorin cobaltochelatase